MTHFKLIPEAHLILIKEGRVLLLRRENTGYEDGNFSVVAGHIDGNETARTAMCREAAEEAGIAIDPLSLRLVHIMHRKATDERVSFFFTTDSWEGIPRNLEPQKCSELGWFRLDSLPTNMVSYVRTAIELCLNKITYSEFGW